MLDRENVRVLYEGINTLDIHTQKDTFYANKSDGVNPSEFIMPLNDLIYLNTISNEIRDGVLYFHEEDKEEVYKALKIRDYEEIMHDHDYAEIILSPTVEGLQKIIDIKDSSSFERIRAILFRLKDSNSFEISSRVETLISARFKELQNRKRNSDISVVDKDIEAKKIASKEIDAIKEQNQNLQEQLSQMQAMMAQLIAQQTQMKTSTDINDEIKAETSPTENEVTETKKNVGRPKAKTTK